MKSYLVEDQILQCCPQKLIVSCIIFKSVVSNWNSLCKKCIAGYWGHYFAVEAELGDSYRRRRSIELHLCISGVYQSVWLLTLFVPAYFDVSGTRGGHIVPPLSILGLGGVRVPILVENDLSWNDLTYSKGFMKFGCLEFSKIMFVFWFFCWSRSV